MRALISGVTGIRTHQVRLDVIGNNIANVNTTGFKSSRVSFQDVFSQTMSAGSASTGPQQVGLGVGVGATDLNHSAGSFQLTGRDLDLAIEGNGMFILRGEGGQNIYSRVGNFDWDADGFLVNPATGQRVQGWVTNAAGAFGSLDAASMGSIQLTRGGVTLAQRSTSAAIGGNLDASAPAGTVVRTTLTAFDSLGRAQTLSVAFTQSGNNTWSWATTGTAPTVASGSGVLSFTEDGLIQPGSATGSISLSAPGASAQSVSLNFQGVTQAYAGADGSSVVVRKVDGYPMGTLESVTVDTSGQIAGVFSNGFRRPLAQVAVATFTNPGGLLKLGANGFGESAASGSPIVGEPGKGGTGRLVPGNLEMSNVDLSTEFTNMIMTQRGFQANTRVISAADEMMQDLVNLRR